MEIKRDTELLQCNGGSGAGGGSWWPHAVQPIVVQIELS